MIEGGLDTLDKVEAGDVDAEDALEFGVKIGEENTGAAAGTMNQIFVFKISSQFSHIFCHKKKWQGPKVEQFAKTQFLNNEIDNQCTLLVLIYFCPV